MTTSSAFSETTTNVLETEEIRRVNSLYLFEIAHYTLWAVTSLDKNTKPTALGVYDSVEQLCLTRYLLYTVLQPESCNEMKLK